MDKYKVKINPKTIRELNSIYEYIAIFRIDDSSKTVFVITIQYQGKNM